MTDVSPSHTSEPAVAPASLGLCLFEIVVIVGLFVILGGGPAPEVNEAHYLAKAKHYWNPQWLAGDIFLESADAHLVFYWTFGWLTLLFPLPVVAWIGRFLTWFLLAFAWRRLSWQLIPRPLCAILSAALFTLGIEYVHLAGEWIIGGVEAKGFAYFCLLMGLTGLARGKWNRCLIWLGGAAALHVLVGGWAIVAVGLAWLLGGTERPPLKSILPGLLLSFGISLIGLVPALLLSRGVDDAQTAELANRIYVAYRLPHHLVFHRFAPWFMVRHAMLLAGIVLAAGWWRKQRAVEAKHLRLAGFVAGCTLIGLCGVVIDQALLYQRPLANSLLRFYWLRLSDIMLPAAGAMLLVMIASRLGRTKPVMGQTMLVLLMALATVGMGANYLQQRADPRPRADAQTLPTFPSDPPRTERVYRDWRRMGDWVNAHTPTDALFLTPRMQQTFKWYARRKEVVSWKDVPQDATGIVDWWLRFRDVHAYHPNAGGLSRRTDAELIELAEKYGADYLVIDRNYARRPIGLEKVYPRWPEVNSTYEVYRVKP